MRKILLCLSGALALACLSQPAFGQVVNVRARSIRTGTTTPSTCSVGDVFFDTDATAGRNIYGCTSANTWTLEGDGSAAVPGSDTQVIFNDGGAFGADAGATYNKTTDTLTLGGALLLGGGINFSGAITDTGDNAVQLANNLIFSNAYGLVWSSTAAYSGSADTGLSRGAAGFVKPTNGSTGNGSLQVGEVSAPATPAANTVYLYAKDSGGVSSLFFKKDDGTEVDLAAAGGTGITSLEGQTGNTQTFADDTNVTIVSASNTHTITWAGTLAKARMVNTTVHTDQSNTYSTGTQSFVSATALLAGNANFQLRDAGNDHVLTITPGTDLTANRVLTITTGDAARTVTLSGNPTLADWFDQSVKQAANPTFAALTVTTLNKVTVTAPASSATLTIADGKTLTASNTLTLAGTDSTTITFQGTDTYVGRATTDTLTNKTYDAAGTGNVFTSAFMTWLPTAGCNNTTAGTMWDLPTSNAPTVACATGTNTQKGVFEFPDSDGDYSAQVTLKLPADWTGAIDANIKWFAAATSGDVVWQVATACVADAETDDPAFNTASTVTDTAKGTTNQTNDAAITGVTATGCAAGELLHLKILRNRTHASDTITGVVKLIGVELVTRRAQ